MECVIQKDVHVHSNVDFTIILLRTIKKKFYKFYKETIFVLRFFICNIIFICKKK